MSLTVGTPNCASANSSGFSVRRTAVLPINSRIPTPGSRHDALDDRVGLGVDGGRIERVVAVHDAQEPGGLLERTLADARHLQELPAVPERAVLVAERDDVLRERFVEAGDPREERRRRGIHIGADRVDAVLDDGVELPRELGLVDIVLVLADADRLRLDAHELGERILQAPRDRDGAAQRHVEIGQLLRRPAPTPSTPRRRPRRP